MSAISNANDHVNESADAAMTGWLQLLQLADSALPVGGQSHSFGLETLIAEGLLSATSLAAFLPDYLVEVASLEVMDRDARTMRGERPTVFSNLKDGTGLASIVAWIGAHLGEAAGLRSRLLDGRLEAVGALAEHHHHHH